MSKIKTAEQLYDKLSEELAWRRQELSSFRSLVESSSLAEAKRNALLRSGITLLYAHWEGFIKTASEFYLEFVSLQRLKHRELAANFVALSLKNMMHEAENSTKFGAHKDITDFFLNDLDTRCTLSYKSTISTRSNLSFAVLLEILDTLGLEPSEYTTKSVVIDEKLLHMRNTIAHGNYLAVALDDYKDLHRIVLQMMETFRTQVDNAASLKEYRRY